MVEIKLEGRTDLDALFKILKNYKREKNNDILEDHYELNEGLIVKKFESFHSHIIIIDDAISGIAGLEKSVRKRPKKPRLKQAKPVKKKQKHRSNQKRNRFVRGSKRSDN